MYLTKENWFWSRKGPFQWPPWLFVYTPLAVADLEVLGPKWRLKINVLIRDIGQSQGGSSHKQLFGNIEKSYSQHKWLTGITEETGQRFGKTKGKVLSIVMIQAIDVLISLKMDVLRLASPVAYPLNSSTFPSEWCPTHSHISSSVPQTQKHIKAGERLLGRMGVSIRGKGKMGAMRWKLLK